jgi:superoxide dismutase, Cu-Zn family
MQGQNQYITTFVIGFILVVLVIFGVGLLLSQAQPTAAPEAAEATAEAGVGATAALKNTSGAEVGEVTFSQDSSGMVTIAVRAHDLPAGFHGFHVHTAGACDPGGDKPFSSAGGHFSEVTDATHSHHTGDMPSLLVNQDGTAEMSFTTDEYKIADLLDSDGSAVIVHADPDNYANIPSRYSPPPDETTLNTGDAGARIACGVIEGK